MKRESGHKIEYQQAKFIEALIDEMESSLAAILSRMTKDYTLVEDVMIITWTLACQKVEMLERHANPKGWIVRAAKYKMYKALEEQKRIYSREIYMLDSLQHSMHNEVEMEIEMRETLRSCLSDDETTLLILKYYYEVSYIELADFFGISEAAVRKRISRALDKLRKSGW